MEHLVTYLTELSFNSVQASGLEKFTDGKKYLMLGSITIFALRTIPNLHL